MRRGVASESRAKVINAHGELQASEELRLAGETLSRNPASLQRRYLRTLLELGADQNSTVVFPLPIDIIGPFLQKVPDLLDRFGHGIPDQSSGGQPVTGVSHGGAPLDDSARFAERSRRPSDNTAERVDRA